MIGTELNHYHVTAVLGIGGMGEVYAAEDTKLHRQVAIKLLPSDVAEDPERRQRFEREARAIAALNHPNIVTIFSIEQANGRLFLTMELVRGQPLFALIATRGLPLDRLLALAIPLADAVNAAHEQGIVHRDLKPGNVMVTDDLRVKVLDFGLARLRDGSDGRPATMLRTEFRTGERAIMGTVAYMSPEQAEGRAVDARSDVFALGVVLYEMATGERPFKGDTDLSILSSIVKDTAPALTSVRPSLPAELARIVRRCLAKDPTRRYQTAADVRNDLADLEQEVASGRSAVTTPSTSRRGRRREAAAWGVTALAAAFAIFAWLEREPRVVKAVDVLSVLPPDAVALTFGETPLLSPDGRAIAFVGTDAMGQSRLYVRERSVPDARVLLETDDVTSPFWSPDSRSIGFFARGQLKRIAATGGRPQTLAAAPVPRGGTWSRDDRIVFVPFPEDPPKSVSAAGGAEMGLPTGPGEWRWYPSFLPDGRHYLFVGADTVSDRPVGIYVGRLDSTESSLLVPGATFFSVTLGYLLYIREGTIVAQSFDTGSQRLEGPPIAVVENAGAAVPTSFSISSDGALAYVGAQQDLELSWFDRSGKKLGHAATVPSYNSLCLSADGTRVVYDTQGSRYGDDLWSLKVADGATSRLTFAQGADFYPICSSSGDDVVFASARRQTPNLYRLSPTTPGGEQLLAEFPLPSLPSDWSRDGKLVLFSAYSPDTGWDVWVLPLGGGEPFPYARTPAEEKNAHFSPDGRWVAYSSNAGGVEEVYVQPFPVTSARWQVSGGGGRQPHWRADGTQLYYLSFERKLMATDIEPSASTFIQSAPRVLIDSPVRGNEIERTHHGNPYAVSADGERFLVAAATDATRPITVVVNWPSRLGRP